MDTCPYHSSGWIWMYRVTTGRSSKFLTTVYRSELPLKTCGNNNKPFKRFTAGILHIHHGCTCQAVNSCKLWFKFVYEDYWGLSYVIFRSTSVSENCVRTPYPPPPSTRQQSTDYNLELILGYERCRNVNAKIWTFILIVFKRSMMAYIRNLLQFQITCKCCDKWPMDNKWENLNHKWKIPWKELQKVKP